MMLSRTHIMSLVVAVSCVSGSIAAAGEKITHRQEVIDNLSGHVRQQTYLSPSGKIVCRIPSADWEDEETDLEDVIQGQNESFAIHIHDVSAPVKNTYSIKKVRYARIGHSPVTDVPRDASVEAKVDGVLELVKGLFSRWFFYNSVVLQEETLDLAGRMARLAVLRFKDDMHHQRYGLLVTTSGDDMVIFDYMPMMVRQGEPMVSAEYVKSGVLAMAEGCPVDGLAQF